MNIFKFQTKENKDKKYLLNLVLFTFLVTYVLQGIKIFRLFFNIMYHIYVWIRNNITYSKFIQIRQKSFFFIALRVVKNKYIVT